MSGWIQNFPEVWNVKKKPRLILVQEMSTFTQKKTISLLNEGVNKCVGERRKEEQRDVW